METRMRESMGVKGVVRLSRRGRVARVVSAKQISLGALS